MLVALFAIPAGLVIGGAAAAGVHAIGRVVDDTLSLLPAVVITGMLTAGVGFAAGLPIATIAAAPPVVMPFATTAAGVAGACLSGVALRTGRLAGTV